MVSCKPLIRDQKWVVLALILSTAYTLPMLKVGEHISLQYGKVSAISAIIIGSLIIWAIGFAVISMADEDSSNAIENIRSYIGNYSSMFLWLILMAAILNWFVQQLHGAMSVIAPVFGLEKASTILRIGASLGLLITFLSAGGIRVLKRVTLISFPFVLVYHLLSFFHPDHSMTTISSSVLPTSSGIISIVQTLLPGALNLPTLFRHAKSKEDAILGLGCMVALITVFQISALGLNFKFSSHFLGSNPDYFRILTVVFSILTVVCINIVNIYYASACWETYCPKFEGARGSVVIGLIGVAIYMVSQNPEISQLVTVLTSCWLGTLCIVLLVGYLIRVTLGHRLNYIERLINLLCWLAGSVAGTISVIKGSQEGAVPLLLGVSITCIMYLLFIFLESLFWAAKGIFAREDDSRKGQ
ncbi:hypothetical protein [Candidatus Neptunichlamydia sp. REUL1]|uniref:hypothetical protein n=1 Tax=Candidatus Neptunichlamydia sp. REUL1 TaxID=3064277 RepID=UPI00292D4530|nr:hypothetical protein [Candidatus Neptunochlamydia sp. REUL1]